MNRTARLSILAAYAAAAAWALAPAPPKPLAATIAPPPPPPTWERPRYERPAPMTAVQHLPMEPADLWALANLRFAELPPVEFDHIPKQRVTITDIATEEQLLEVCRWPKNSGKTLVGCADHKDPNVCHIYRSGSIPSWAGLTRNIVIRHEMGHCNGWGKDLRGCDDRSDTLKPTFASPPNALVPAVPEAAGAFSWRQTRVR